MDHIADIAFAVSRDSLASLSQEGLLAMWKIAGVKLQKKRSIPSRKFLEANSPELLLAVLLSEAIILMEINQQMDICDLEIEENKLLFTFQIGKLFPINHFKHGS